jgi:hypothetical protein
MVAQFNLNGKTSWVCEDHSAALEQEGHELLRRIPAGAMPIEHFDTRIKKKQKTSTLTFCRSYLCLSCHETSSREGAAGEATLWVDCDKCKGPAHCCHSIPCNICQKYLLLNVSDTIHDYAKRFGLKAALDEFGGDYVAKAYGLKP